MEIHQQLRLCCGLSLSAAVICQDPTLTRPVTPYQLPDCGSALEVFLSLTTASAIEYNPYIRRGRQTSRGRREAAGRILARGR
jgi:hypothetical protein